MNPNEPEPPDTPPRAPQTLSTTEAEWFGKITAYCEAMRIASWVDTVNVMLLAKRLTEIEECDRAILEQGRTFVKTELIKIPVEEKAKNGKIKTRIVVRAQKVYKANPAVAMRSEAMRHAQSLAAEFGLSPASRSKVSSSAGRSEESFNPWQQLLAQRRRG